MAPTAPEANSTCAIGTPLARLFLEPQKTMVISSALSKPSLRAIHVVDSSASASSTASTASRPANAVGDTCFHRPSITAALNAV